MSHWNVNAINNGLVIVIIIKWMDEEISLLD